MEACINGCRCSGCWIDPMLEEALGYLNKSNSEDEIMWTGRKKESKVMGYNQEEIMVEINDSIELKKKVGSSQDTRAMDVALASGLMLKFLHLILQCISSNKTAETRLYEICDANKWKTPEFVLWKEEGTMDKKSYTYQVTVEVETITSTILECFSEPRSEKGDARVHAAEGALWYLKHLRYT